LADNLPANINNTSTNDHDLTNNADGQCDDTTANCSSNNDGSSGHSAGSPSNDNTIADNQDDVSALPPFPPNTMAAKVEDELPLIHEYLQCPRPPSHLHGEALTHFLRRAGCYTLANNRLWRLQHNG
jgi:hypothetical protein